MEHSDTLYYIIILVPLGIALAVFIYGIIKGPK